jgi:hypothetical protein
VYMDTETTKLATTWELLSTSPDEVNGTSSIVSLCEGGECIRIGVSLARMCPLFRDLLESSDLMETGGEAAKVAMQASVMPLDDITFNTMTKVLKYVEHFTTRIPTVIPKPLLAPLSSIVSSWEWHFLNTECLVDGNSKAHLDLILVMKAADFLCIDSLRELTCAMMAEMTINKTEEELMDLFGLDAPYTEEDFEPVYEKYPFMRPEINS